MSEFMDRARAEAEQKVARRREAMWENEGEHLSRPWGMGFERGFVEGAEWAVEQEPTDSETDAADKAFHEVIMSGEWVTQEQAIRAALRAAQKVRAGQ